MADKDKKRKFSWGEGPNPSTSKKFSWGIGATATVKRPHKELTLEEKVEMVNVYETSVPKMTQRDLGRRYGVANSTVSDILKRREELKRMCEDYNGSQRKRKSTGRYSQINDVIFRWVLMARSKKLPLNGSILQTKACEIAQRIGHTDFKASNGWLVHFKAKYLMKHFVEDDAEKSETTSSNQNIAAEFLYSPEDTFVADEISLFYRNLPKHNDHFKKRVEIGDFADERVTVLLCCSCTGEKLKPLIIGQSPQVDSIQPGDKNNVTYTYNSNPKSWTTDAVFAEWLKNLNYIMMSNKRKIMVYVDRAPSHVHLNLSHLAIQYLTKKQPFDMGIKLSFKSHYRKNMLKFLLARAERDQDVLDLCPSITLSNGIHWISKSWQEVPINVIIQGYQKAGFPIVHNEGTTASNKTKTDGGDISLQRLVSLSKADHRFMDLYGDDVPTELSDKGDWETEIINDYLSQETEDEQPNTTVDNQSMLSHSTVLTMLDDIRKFALTKDSSYINKINELICETEEMLVQQRLQNHVSRNDTADQQCDYDAECSPEESKNEIKESDPEPKEPLKIVSIVKVETVDSL